MTVAHLHEGVMPMRIRFLGFAPEKETMKTYQAILMMFAFGMFILALLTFIATHLV